ncbi:hypothetical protein AB0O58_15560 [Rhodococcus sp. NPDC080181]|uniref:hypothetical protein n=1 Tax=Rhodococcus sp. NPDC080181 TaxID=3155292 RepID=UPI00344C573F
MSVEGSQFNLDEVRAFAVKASNVGQYIAHFALAAAKHSPQYREPGVESMDAVDLEIGHADDVEGPLLTAHRLAKFYVISAGDALLSCCELVGRDFPMHIGSAALARVTAEHASRAMFVGDPEIGWKIRVLRTHALFHAALQEYRSSSELGALELLEAWKKWRNRTGATFSDIPKQSAGSNRKLIEDAFPHALAYDELSRPTHGNAVWLTLAVIQEQKRTNYTWCATLRNVQFAMDATIAAAHRLCLLWDLDPNEVFTASQNGLGVDDPLTWDTLLGACDAVRAGVDELSNAVVVDSTPDPQPPR